jgi:hypothetical protein
MEVDGHVIPLLLTVIGVLLGQAPPHRQQRYDAQVKA